MGYIGNKKSSEPGRADTPPNFVPDPKKHLYVSLGKSVVRIAGYALLIGIATKWSVIAAVVLIASELIGIIEELV